MQSRKGKGLAMAGKADMEAVKEKRLTRKEVRSFEAILRARLSQVEGVVGKVIPKTFASDPADMAVQETEVSQNLYEQETARREIISINQALNRIADGEFGICEDCEIQIPRKRLESQPTAKCCIDCTRAREQMAQRQRVRGGTLEFSEI